MELCPEGTLESLIEISAGLHESLTRRFTAQLLLGMFIMYASRNT